MKRAAILILLVTLIWSCDRQTDDFKPAPIGPGNSTAGMAFGNGTKGVTFVLTGDTTGEDTVQTKDTVFQELPETEVAVDTIENIDTSKDTSTCDGTAKYCACLEDPGATPAFCTCETETHPNGDDYYCECCFIAFDPGHPLYNQWSFLVPDVCATWDIYSAQDCN